MNHANTSFYERARLYLVACSFYPVIFFISIPFSQILVQYGPIIARQWFVMFLEKYIVRGWIFVWFTLLYFANIGNFNGSLSKVNVFDPIVLKSIKIYIVSMIWIVFLLEWFFGSPIFERISVWKGAHCTDSRFAREYACENGDGEWTSPFDPSSHYTILISSSLLIRRLVLPLFPELLLEAKYRNQKNKTLQQLGTLEEGFGEDTRVGIGAGNNLDSEARVVDGDLEDNVTGTVPSSRIFTSKTLNVYQKIVTNVSFLFLLLWLILFCITSFFFHTIPEKVLGLICGMLVPVVAGLDDMKIISIF